MVSNRGKVVPVLGSLSKGVYIEGGANFGHEWCQFWGMHELDYPLLQTGKGVEAAGKTPQNSPNDCLSLHFTAWHDIS